MIRERKVLFGIKSFQQSTCGISVKGGRKFIYFIQNHNGVGNACFVNSVHNPSRHSSDIRTAMASDIRFVMDAAQTDANIFTSECFCNALSDAGFSCARCANKQQNGTGLLLL